jgi:putative CocE/NonD family hydrolase
MRVVSAFPRKVAKRDPVFIPLADGTQIAATIWLPEDAEQSRVPAVVEMVPYRRRDGTIFRDTELMPYLAGHGIAGVRIDIRGSGDSTGVLADEYLPLEQQDGVEIIAWLAAQSWCNGNVGMTGISWGGFNALQVAALRPPALKAIVALCCSDDRYSDDVHYMGGCLLTEDPLWSGCMLTYNALPPDPQIVGARWRDMWQQRMRANRSFSEHWLSHQRRDAYWQQGSICEDWSRIDIPVYAISGWDDSYPSSVLRVIENAKGPRKGLVGPWNHMYPCRGAPGPLIGYMQEMVRWWSHWLTDKKTDIMDGPMLVSWINGQEPPRAYYDTVHEGRWVAEQSWPSPRMEQRRLYLNDGALGARPQGNARRMIASPVTAGAECGRWGGYGGTCPDMAVDQRREDGMALCFDGPVLEQDFDILGIAELHLAFAVDAPRANICARLCEVSPDGTSSLITYGVLNLAHRESHEFPSDLAPGKADRATLIFKATGRRVSKGNFLRVAIATQHWPVIWPSPTLTTLTVIGAESFVTLPVRPAQAGEEGYQPFGPPEIAPSIASQSLRDGHHTRTVSDEVGSGVRTITLFTDYGNTALPEYGIVTNMVGTDVFQIRNGDPLSAVAQTEWVSGVQSGDADVEATARTRLTSDAESFYLEWNVVTRERGKVVHETGDTKTIRRDYL